MVRCHLIVSLALFGLASACQRDSASHQAVETSVPDPKLRASVDSALRGYGEAYNRADAAAVVALYSQGSAVSTVSDGQLIRGWPAVRADLDSTIPGLAGRFRLDFGSSDILSLGSNHALVVAPFTLTVAAQQGAILRRGALTLVFERADSGWRVLHEHSSFVH